MVLTRSQASKNKAAASPEPVAAKLTKKQQRGAADPAAEPPADPAADPAQQPRPLVDKRLNLVVGSLGTMGLKPSSHKKGGGLPASHPIDSLPSSPAAGGAAGRSPTPEFTIPAAQPQQVQQEEAAAVAAAAPASTAAAAPASQQQQQQQQPPEQAAAPVEARHVPAAAPAERREPSQQAQLVVPQPRPEKLLKPLPDKPVPCDKLPDGPEPVVVEVEYVAREDLAPLEAPDAALAAALAGLEGSDWVEAVRCLNLLRQLVAHHPEACASQLDTVMPLVLKSVRSLRSSVCKTAIMAAAELYLSYGDALLPHTDVGGQAKPLTSLLAQLLLKCGSGDKKFVVDEAQRALGVLGDSLAPAALLPLLLPYAEAHKNPKVRGKAGGAVAAAAARLDAAGVAAFGLPRLLQAASKLVTDNTPDARDSAKRLIGQLRAAFADPGVEAQLGVEAPPPAPDAEGEEPVRQPTKWEAFCQANLSGSAALAVLKASAE